MEENITEVELINKYPNIQGFGLEIAGGRDRPYVKDDNGIFISAVKKNSLAEKSGQLQIGDKIVEVNCTNVTEASHEEAVQLFMSNRKLVKLKVQKNKAQILQAASLTPPSSGKSLSPMHSSRRRPGNEDYNNLSISGFLIGVFLGCASVVIIRRYLSRPPNSL